MVRESNYKRIEYKNNTILVRCIDQLTIKQCMRSHNHQMIELYYLHFLFDLYMIARQ